jgi:FkbM family methyltransferase
MFDFLKRRFLLVATSLIGKWRLRLLGKHVHALLCETENGRLLINASDFSIGKKLAFDGKYQIQNLNELLNMVDGTSRVLFVGVHVGSFLIPVSKKVREVVGVEANPDTRGLLLANLYLNDVKNAEILPFAASDHSGEVEFLASPSNTGGSKIRLSKEQWEFTYDHPTSIRVKAEPLDSHVHGPFDLIVMDVEGAEYQALRGMDAILSETKILQVEYIPMIQDAAGVGAEEFAQLLARYFSKMRFASGNDQKFWTRNEFADILGSLRTKGNSLGEDLILYKD